MPIVEMERRTFADKAARDALGGYRRLVVDVTKGRDASDDLMDALDVATIPANRIHSDAGPLYRHLTGDGREPKPTVAIDEFIDAEAFLAKLPKKLSWAAHRDR